MNKDLKIDISKIPSEKCKCGCIYWDHKTVYKKIPKLLIGALKDAFTPLDVAICSDCKKIHPDHAILIGLEIKPLGVELK